MKVSLVADSKTHLADAFSFPQFDYSSILQVLLEYNINLHILMDQDFDLTKKRDERAIFGFDREHAYTKKYLKDLKGDVILRQSMRMPKDKLGLCTALAIESNGAVFAAKKLRPGEKSPYKKFALVFAKRVAKSAIPNRCQMCECSGHNNGIAYMSCTSCSSDYDLDDEKMLLLMQAGMDFSDEDFDDADIE